ncbi:hypothetical protein SynMITS9220_01101 [Synechococcus sp. MIT S9220]|nr:hypothetical protein SynMITS9220_01101 [Synechococcus sp. MIT S9220]
MRRASLYEGMNEVREGFQLPVQLTQFSKTNEFNIDQANCDKY